MEIQHRRYAEGDETTLTDSDRQGPFWLAVGTLCGLHGKVVLTTGGEVYDMTPAYTRALALTLLRTACVITWNTRRRGNATRA